MSPLTALNRKVWLKGRALSVRKRSFYMWLNFVFNRVDEGRIEEFGPDRVAAEWVLRCGGGVKFKHLDKWMWNYNAIPDGPKGKLMLEGINAKGVSITTGGLQHLVGLEYLKQLNMNGCRYITDTSKLLPVRESLEKLDMGNCVAISDITPLNEMTKLIQLNLINTPRIKQREEAIAALQRAIPGCVIEK
ncbi:PREDICTED: ATP synthase subunit s, mitochondrial-like isoform X1 [Acropora digitifera]|uniref:ATP synthase subunit s, mitochondrial-like isoform X1 n=2 Tax=Acropora digitifera TaxID=70779 RepID=UPI00077A2F15|nr:PREDICTED: ATP synthase subunit s, mitochondrial-like isoform X1 [Acropora digitifera]